MKFSTVVFTLLSIVLLAGCTTRPGSPPQRQDAKALSSSHGMVFVHFPRTTPDQLWIRASDSDEQFYQLERNIHKSTFQLWLPPGQYRLYSAIFGKVGTAFDGFPSFTVEADKITSLGGLSNFNLGGDQVLWLPKSTSRTQTLLKDVQAKLGQLLTLIQINHWQVPTLPAPQTWLARKFPSEVAPFLKRGDKNKRNQVPLGHQDIERFYQASSNALPPLAYQVPGKDNDGKLYYGGEFGLIKVRRPDGRWYNIQTSLQQPITKVVWSKGLLLVAAKNAKLILSDDNGQSWQPLKSFDIDEHIYDIAIDEQSLMVLTTKPDQDSATVMLYHAARSQSPEFKQEMVFSYSTDNNAYPFGQLVNGRYYIGLRPKTIESDTDLFESTTAYYFDNGTLTLHGSILPRPYSFYSVSDNGLITLYYSKGVLSGLMVSSDGGNKWQDKPYPGVLTTNAIFSDTNNGTAMSYRVVQNRLKSYRLHRYNPQENLWSNANDVPLDCKYMLKDSDQSIRFCVTQSNQILSLDAKGWKYERFE